MKIFIEIPESNYPDKFIPPNSPLYDFISKLNSLINKEQQFIEFISPINIWTLPQISLWSIESVLNYIDELLLKYSSDLSEDTIKNKLKPLLRFLFVLLLNSRCNDIFASFEILENIFFRTNNIKVKVYIIRIFKIFMMYNKDIKGYINKIYEMRTAFINMPKILMEFINNNYQFNTKIISHLEDILLKLNKNWKDKANSIQQTNIEEMDPFLIFREIINNNKDYGNINDFQEIQKVYEYFTNKEIYNNLYDLNPNISSDEIIYIALVNNFFCVLNFLSMINSKKIETKKIYLIFEFCFSLFTMCFYKISGFEEKLVSNDYIESIIQDTIFFLTSKSSIKIKVIFIRFYLKISENNKTYEKIFTQNNIFKSILDDMTHQNDNNLLILTKEDSLHPTLLNLILEFYFKRKKELPKSNLNNILQVPKDNLYLHNISNVFFCLNNIIHFNKHLIIEQLIPRLIYELEHLNSPDCKLIYNIILSDFKNYKIYPHIFHRILLINKIITIIFRFISKTTNIEKVNEIDAIIIEPIRRLITNEEMKKNNNLNSVYINSIYLLIKICNAFPSKIPEYISNGIIPLIFDYFSNSLPKADGIFYLILYTIYSISIHDKGKEYILKKNNGIKLLNSVFNKIKFDEEYFYYKLYLLKETSLEVYLIWTTLIEKEGMNDIINCYYDNYISLLKIVINKFNYIQFESSETLNLNLEQYLTKNKFEFIFQSLYPLNNIYINNIINIDLYEDKNKILAKLFISLLTNPNFLLLNTFIPKYSELIKQEKVSSMEALAKLFNNFNELIKNSKILNLHEYQKDKILKTYQQILQSYFNEIYLKINPIKESLYNFYSIFTKLFIQRINEKSNINTYLTKYEGKAFIINDKNYIHFLSNNIKPEIKKIVSNIVKSNDSGNNNFMILNEDNYLDLKIKPKFDEQIRIENIDNINNNEIINDLIVPFIKKNFNVLESLNYIALIEGKIITTDLSKISLEDCEFIKNDVNLGYFFTLILKYFRKEIFENISANSETKNIISNLIKLENIINIFYNLFINNFDTRFSSIEIFYIIKFGGVRQLLKIANKLIELSKNESKKNMIPIVEAIIINNIWEKLSSLVLFFIRYIFSKSSDYLLLLIFESEFTEKIKYESEIQLYSEYIILKDIKDIFFNKENFEQNLKQFSSIELYSLQLYKTILFILDEDLFYTSKDVLKKCNREKIYKKGHKVYEVMQAIQEGNYTDDSILKYLNQDKKNKKDKKEKKEINHELLCIDEYNPFPESDFIVLIKKTLDENNKVFKPQKDKENKNVKINPRNSDFTLDKFTDLINDMMNLINMAEVSNNMINNLRRQSLNFRTILDKDEDNYLVDKLKKYFEDLNSNKNNILLNSDEKLEQELLIKMRINFTIQRYHQIFNAYYEDKVDLYNFIKKYNIVDYYISSLISLIKNMNTISITNNSFNKNKIDKLVFENIVTIYLCFKYLYNIKKDFDDEKKLYLDMMTQLLQYESENKNPNKSIINENILIMLLIIIIKTFNDIKILIPYLEKGLLANILRLKFNKRNSYKNFCENNFKSKVVLNECFNQFMLKIFSDENNLQHLIESVLLYVWTNLKSFSEKNEIYLEDFLHLFSDYVQNHDLIFKKAFINLFNIEEVEKKIKPDKNAKNNKIKIKRIISLKSDYKEKEDKIKSDLIIYGDKNEFNKEKIKNKTQLLKDIYRNLLETNKSILHQLLKHIWICTVKIKKNQENNIKTKNYIIDLDTSLIALTNILYSFPSYLSMVLLLKKGKKHKISFIKFLVKKIIPALYHYKNNNNDFNSSNIKNEIKAWGKNYHAFTESDINIIESFKNINIIKSLIHAMTYRRRNMDELEIFLIKKCRKKILFIINDTLKKISTKYLNDFNNIQNHDSTETKNLIKFKNNILVLYIMSEFHSDSHIYSQYNPFEITKIILSEKCDIIKSISNILKNMKVNSNNQLYHEMGVMYLNNILKYCPVKLREKDNLDFDSYSMEEEYEENIESNMEEENEDEEEDNNNSENNNSYENEDEMDEELIRNDQENNEERGENNSERRREEDEEEENDEIEEDSEQNDDENNEIQLNETMLNNSNEDNENINFEEENYNEQNLSLNNNNESDDEEEMEQLEQNENEDINNEDDYQDEIREESEEFEEYDYDSFYENDDFLEHERMMRHFDFDLFHNDEFYEEYSNSSYYDYNDYDDESSNKDRKSNFGVHFEKYRKNINDQILFQSLPDKKNNNIYNSWYDLYFEESISFNFSFYQMPRSILYSFYKNNLEIKLFQKKKKLDNFDKINSSFIYIYITPLDDIFLQNYTYFVLLGSKEEKCSHYYKLLNKIQNITNNICSYRGKNLVNITNLKTIRNDLLKEANVLKLPKKKKINKKNNFRDNLNFYSFFSYNYSTPSEYLFYPFIHFDDNNDNKTKKDLNKDKEENNNKKENENNENNINQNQAEEKNNTSIGVQTENQEIKNDNNDIIDINENIKPEEKEKSKYKDNNENIDNDKDKENEGDNNGNINNSINDDNTQFICGLPNELREDILKNLDPSLVPNLSTELQSEYHRLKGTNYLKVPPLTFPPPPLNKKFQSKQDKIEENIEKEKDNLDEFEYNEIHLNSLSYYEYEILMEMNYSKKNINKIIKAFDDDFIENLILYNKKNIYWKKFFLLFKNDNLFANSYYQLIETLITNVQLKHKILDLFFTLWIFHIVYNKEESLSKESAEKNNFLKSYIYLNLEKTSNEDIFIDYFENLIYKLIGNFSKSIVKYFLDYTFKENGAYISLKNKKEFTITKNAINIKKILNIKCNKNKNVLNNLFNQIFSYKANYFQTIYQLKIFTTIVKECKYRTNNNYFILEKDREANKNIINLDENIIDKLIDLFYNFRINIGTKRWECDNNPTLLLNEFIIDKNEHQIIYDKILKRLKILKNNIIQDINKSFFNNDINVNIKMTNYNMPLPEHILLSLLLFVRNLQKNICIKTNNKSKDNKKIKTELLMQFANFISKINKILFPCWEQLDKLLNEINKKIKDGEKKIESKYLIFLPFLQSFIILSFLYINFNSKYNKNNSAQFIIEKNYKSEQKSPLRNDILTFTDTSFIQYFNKFCDDNKKLINIILKKYPYQFPRGLILIISKILDLENKKKYFKQELRKLPYKSDYQRIKVRRNGVDLFNDSFNALSSKKSEQWRSKLIVTFEGEEAIDAGGVKREWLTLLSKEMFNPNYMLFTLAKNGTTYSINQDSGRYNMDHLRQFEFIGKIMAKAIYDGMMLDCYFSRIIYKLITNTPISYHDMEDYDPQFFKSIKILLENDYTGKDTYLTYSYNHDNFGQMEIVDLIENGRNVDVTENNKFDYVQKLCSAKLYDNIKPQVEALLKGFYEIIPQKLISIFNYNELELVISGSPKIDINDWKKNTQYENYNENTPIIKYFWEIIESYDDNERAEFLQFVTGSCKIPLEGFKALPGIGGVNKFLISKVFDKNFDRLPTAHTCTNQLDLPEYPTKEILKQRLHFAVKEGKGFGFI